MYWIGVRDRRHHVAVRYVEVVCRFCLKPGFMEPMDNGAETGTPANLIRCCLSQLETLLPQLPTAGA
eukprot:4851974-Pyramimonas_sp.AAC.1